MTFSGSELPPIERPVQSLVGRLSRADPEIQSLPCVDPVETAADKISALAWRTAARDRRSAADDPTLIRHLHDLAALAPLVRSNLAFAPLVRRLLEKDSKRAGNKSADGAGLLLDMLPTITGDPLWRREYEEFVGAVSFGPATDRTSFDQAIAACERLVANIP